MRTVTMSSNTMRRIPFALLVGLFISSQADAAEPVTNDLTAAHISRSEQRPSLNAPAEHFVGMASVLPLFGPEAPARASAAYVTFEPGARTAWHTHPVGQHLVITDGTGYVQFEGGLRQTITNGDVVWIPPNQKHWHGASASDGMTHLAVQEQMEGHSTEWFDQVNDTVYQASEAPSKPTGPSRAQQLMGDVAPKLAELTDNVLYADIWQREGLSKRDRSLATVSALVALNRPEQLRSHIGLALQNGVTRSELAEVFTQLAFYTGWPNAVSAVIQAKDVFASRDGNPSNKNDKSE